MLLLLLLACSKTPIDALQSAYVERHGHPHPALTKAANYEPPPALRLPDGWQTWTLTDPVPLPGGAWSARLQVPGDEVALVEALAHPVGGFTKLYPHAGRLLATNDTYWNSTCSRSFFAVAETTGEVRYGEGPDREDSECRFLLGHHYRRAYTQTTGMPVSEQRVEVFDLLTGERRTITTPPDAQTRPEAIPGGVVWRTSEGGRAVDLNGDAIASFTGYFEDIHPTGALLTLRDGARFVEQNGRRTRIAPESCAARFVGEAIIVACDQRIEWLDLTGKRTFETPRPRRGQGGWPPRTVTRAQLLPHPDGRSFAILAGRSPNTAAEIFSSAPPSEVPKWVRGAALLSPTHLSREYRHERWTLLDERGAPVENAWIQGAHSGTDGHFRSITLPRLAFVDGTLRTLKRTGETSWTLDAPVSPQPMAFGPASIRIAANDSSLRHALALSPVANRWSWEKRWPEREGYYARLKRTTTRLEVVGPGVLDIAEFQAQTGRLQAPDGTALPGVLVGIVSGTPPFQFSVETGPEGELPLFGTPTRADVLENRAGIGTMATHPLHIEGATLTLPL